ncbi:hypothetical protein C7B65_07195 [Phormidesmis priestleyi ULC007]|uniref:Uncharacterized protein n=1 Tax=Phormidesmis priestleyi ULC007 TaxID=1920490 RepID=A0A2T1DJK2_9CYAN|nr:hypothetical protein [Phormidesmis priestleyi]PSB20677.1 hypothetical protein C7B65_07195 [Phormidesmis priestleyi ULC007]PZO54347.1 MAG: hypothetical protein DCF14_02840 [Phormidesmis priestleyi]
MAKTITIEFAEESYLKQSTEPVDKQGTDNVIKQGKGSRYVLDAFGNVDTTGHREVKIPVAPGGKTTWFVFAKHVREV